MRSLLTRCFLAELGGSSVLLITPPRPSMAAARGADRDHGGGVVGWWVLAQALARAVVRGMAHGVESGGELGVPIADQEADGADLLTPVDQQIAGGLGGPGRGRVSGHPKDVHRAGRATTDQAAPL